MSHNQLEIAAGIGAEYGFAVVLLHVFRVLHVITHIFNFLQSQICAVVPGLVTDQARQQHGNILNAAGFLCSLITGVAGGGCGTLCAASAAGQQCGCQYQRLQ